MTENASFSQCLTNVTTAVQRGDIRSAKRYAAHLLNQLDTTTRAIVATCVETIERYPEHADIHLRARWRSTTDNTHRTVITAFGTAFMQREPRPTPADHRPKRDPAPRDQNTEIRPQARRTLTEQDRAALRARDHAEAITTDYAPRAGVNDEPPDTPVYASGLDFDLAAVPALHGTPCVRCWLERTPTDHHRHSDDGLCGECRDKGRTGIRDLPTGHTRADAVQARCAFLTATYPNARALLARWWQAYATPTDRTVITDWVHQHPFPDPQPQPTTEIPEPRTSTPEPDTDPGERCTRCGYPRNDNAPDTVCDQCRSVDEMIAQC